MKFEPLVVNPLRKDQVCTGGDKPALIAEVSAYPASATIAYAKLFAEAPGLLEACKRLLGCMSLAGWESDPTAEFAREVIARIEK